MVEPKFWIFNVEIFAFSQMATLINFTSTFFEGFFLAFSVFKVQTNFCSLQFQFSKLQIIISFVISNIIFGELFEQLTMYWTWIYKEKRCWQLNSLEESWHVPYTDFAKIKFSRWTLFMKWKISFCPHEQNDGWVYRC